MQDLPCSAPEFTDDDSQQVQSTGSLTFVWQDAFARSIAPTSVADVLSPFGTQVWVYLLIEDGPAFSERVPMGQYLVDGTPSINTNPDAVPRHPDHGRRRHQGDALRLVLWRPGRPVLHARLAAVARVDVERGAASHRPPCDTHGRVPDAKISGQVAYQEDRLQAVYDLANYSLDAVPFVTPDGTVSMRPNEWPDPVDVLEYGTGNLIDVGRGMADDDVYNAIAVRAYDSSDGSAILASGQVNDGRCGRPSRTVHCRRSAVGRRSTRRSSSPRSSRLATTSKWLPRVSRLTGVEVELTEVLNPLRELGDVLTVRDIGHEFIGRVSKIRRSDSGQQITTVKVGEQ